MPQALAMGETYGKLMQAFYNSDPEYYFSGFTIVGVRRSHNMMDSNSKICIFVTSIYHSFAGKGEVNLNTPPHILQNFNGGYTDWCSCDMSWSPKIQPIPESFVFHLKIIRPFITQYMRY